MNDSSDTLGDAGQQRSSSKLETLSRDDLLKFVKKQMLQLKKSNARCEELVQELENVKEQLTKGTHDAEIVEEHKQLLEVYSQSQESLERSASKISTLEDQVDCMSQKLETVTALYQAVQQEYDSLKLDNKKLQLENEVLLKSADDQRDAEKSRDDGLATAVAEREQLEHKLTEMTELCRRAECRIAELEQLRKDDTSDLSELRSTKAELERNLHESKEKFQALSKTYDELVSECNQLKEENNATSSRSDARILELQQSLDIALEKSREADENLKQILLENDQTKSQLQAALDGSLEITNDRERVILEYNNLKRTFNDVSAQFADVKCNADALSGYISEIDELKKQILALQSNVAELQNSCVEADHQNSLLRQHWQSCQKLLEDMVTDAESVEISAQLSQKYAGIKDVHVLICDRNRELCSLKRDCEETRDLQRQLESSNVKLTAELDAERSRCEQLSVDVGQLRQQLQRSEESRLELVSKSNALEVQLNSSEQIKSELNPEVCDQLQPSDVMESFKEKDAEIERLKAELQSMKQAYGGNAVSIDPSVAAEELNDKETISETVASSSSMTTGSSALNSSDETSVGIGNCIVGNVGDSEERDEKQELEAAKQKLAEWEAMMLMLQTERSDAQKELARLQMHVDKAANVVSEMLDHLLGALRDRDLFPATEHLDKVTDEDDSGLLTKFGLLRSITDEMIFERDEMKEKINHYVEQISLLEEQSQNKNSEKDAAIDELSKLRETLQAVKLSEENVLKRELELLSQLEAADARGDELTVTLNESETKIQTLLKAESDLKLKLQESEAAFDEMTKKMKTNEDELRNLSNESSENDGRKSEIERLHVEIESKSQQIAVLEMKKEEWKNTCDEHTDKLKNLTADHEASNSEILRLKCELEELKLQNVEIQKTSEQVCHRVADAEEKYANEHQKVLALMTDLEMLQTVAKQSTDKIDALNAQLEAVTSERDELQLMKNELNSKLADADSQHNELINEFDKFKSSSLAMQKNASELEADCAAKLKAEEERFLACNSELIAVRNQLAESCQNVARLESELEHCHAELKAKFSVAESSENKTEMCLSKSQLGDINHGSNVAESVETDRIGMNRQAELESLQQQLKDHEDRENKFKQLALKAKREAADIKIKLESCEKELAAARQEIMRRDSTANQSLQLEYDQLEAKYDNEKKRASDAESCLKKAAEELSSLRVAAVEWVEEKERLMRNIEMLEQSKKNFDLKLNEKDQQLQAEAIQRDQLCRDKFELESRLVGQQQIIKELEDSSRQTEKNFQEQISNLKEKLNAAQRDVHQNSMMDLEIKDYERTVRTLTENVAEYKNRTVALEEELKLEEGKRAQLQKLVETVESQYTQAEEQISKLKQLLVKTKKDLAEEKKAANEQRTADAQVKVKLEMSCQTIEEQKLQIAKLLAENQRLKDKLQQLSETNNRASRAVDLRVQSLEHELDAARTELTNVQSEYESYKVRVHSVLKQQKTKSSVDVSAERDRAECQRLEKLIEQLKTQLQEQRELVKSHAIESQLLQDEYDRLQQRYSKVVEEAEKSERSWRDRVDRLNAENSANSARQLDTIQQLTVNNDSLAKTFKDQLSAVKEEYGHTIDNLRYRLENAEMEIDRLQLGRINAADSISLLSAERGSTPDKPVVEFVRELKIEERQSGEGSENTEEDAGYLQSTKATSPGGQQSLIPFEKLLNSQASDDASSVRTIDESLSDDTTLKSLLTASEKHNQHLTVLLNESEAAVLRLTEQASVLKGEIRRLERNQERENSISNMEYLKNVVYKFLTLKSGNERLQLIPVLMTMLKFSLDERETLVAIATAQESHVPPGEQPLGGWGSYFNRWSGGLV